jgi:nicotinate-nucleotide adenylyltransferase
MPVGLLGGSFNPAHDGHRHISLAAMARLGLREVWWLVSPQNPLKPVQGMAPFAERLASAQSVADHPRIRVTDIERRLGTRYTADTLCALRRHHPRIAFVWLMGADNLIQVPRWEKWTDIFATVPVAILDRPSYSLRALAGKVAIRYRHHRLGEDAAKGLAKRQPPAWVFLHGKLHPASATQIRQATRTENE